MLLSLNGPFSSLIPVSYVSASDRSFSGWGLPPEPASFFLWADDLLQSLCFYFQSQWRTSTFPQEQALKPMWLSFLPSFYSDQRIDRGEKVIRGLVTELVFFWEKVPSQHRQEPLLVYVDGLDGWLGFALQRVGPFTEYWKSKFQHCLLQTLFFCWNSSSNPQIAVRPHKAQELGRRRGSRVKSCRKSWQDLPTVNLPFFFLFFSGTAVGGTV